MMIVDRLNDPEYRWQHKDELREIMRRSSQRRKFKIEVLDYALLREKNDSKIIECSRRNFDWNTFKDIVYAIPGDLDRSISKKTFQPADRLHFETRDGGICYICGSVYHYGSCNKYRNTDRIYNLSHLHHVIPNGPINDANIITLCVHCHQIVHHALFLTGKWKYGNPL